VALFVVVVVGLVIAQTWLDWRDAKRDWVLPEWAKGLALAGVVAASLTGVTSFASSWIQDSTGQWAGGLASRFFWPELGFLFCAMAIVVAGVRTKRMRLMLVLTGILTAAFWLGMTLSS
jgi:hypothetical protein